MRSSQPVSALLAAALLFSLLPSLPADTVLAEAAVRTHSFDEPIDAISFRMLDGGQSVEMQYLQDQQWKDWTTVDIDTDVDPVETQMLMLPRGVTAIRTRGTSLYEVHPIRVSSDPVKFRVADSRLAQASKRVLSRSEWGADASLLTQSDSSSDSDETDKGDNGSNTTPTVREQDCVKAQREYPEQFKINSIVDRDAQGRMYRWPVQYSKDVHLFVVHHTALLVSGDTRSGAERMRALYAYHSKSRGWGDIGYNYVIDETGQIYEGRNGGKYAVGGHAYCNNIGTIGISLMGNFELEQPSQSQVKSLQWLIDDLSKTYGVNIAQPVEHHGKKFVSPIAGHRDLVSTSCPGYSMYGAMGQVIANVKSGNVLASVVFPDLKKNVSGSSSSARSTGSAGVVVAPGLSTQGRMAIATNPGGKQRLNVAYTADIAGGRAGTTIANVRRSSPEVLLWQQDGDAQLPISDKLFLQYDVPSGDRLEIPLLVQAPLSEGNQWIDIGGLRFSLQVAGRRARTGTFVSPFDGSATMKIVPPPVKPRPVLRKTGRLRTNTLARSRASVSVSHSSSSFSLSTPPPLSTPSILSSIRIRLSIDASPTVTFASRGWIANTAVSTGERAMLAIKNNQCEASIGAQRIADDVLRLSAEDHIWVDTVQGKHRGYRGTIECRIVDGKLALINELPLDDYMRGLSEEPDTEPYEKQRAFAIAARTYAAYYMRATGDLRKFPGKPYDGADDPAIFQAYAGVTFENQNPRWLDAVAATAMHVLTVDGIIIKPPYFSSDSGRTRSPQDVGWNNFPFAHVYTPKDDPWCTGMVLRGHGVGMSGCGALGQAKEGRSAEQILEYYYPGTRIMGFEL